MELDLQKIASAREKNRGQTGAMNYLLSPIRRELEVRIAHGTANHASGLIIDFQNTDLEPASIEKIQHCPVLEQYTRDAGMLTDYSDQGFDCAVVNLQMSWLDYEHLIGELKRVLRPGGSLYFSAFGPDTLNELRQSWQSVDNMPHVHPFTDMHHIGDALLNAGFVNPIVDADWYYIDYPGVRELIEDLRQEGFINIHAQRRKTLTGKNRYGNFERELVRIATQGENLKLSFEIIYGFAAAPDLSDGSIRVTPPNMDQFR